MTKSKHPLYSTHRHIIDRCRNPNSDVYKYYGGRGIKVCDEWADDFWTFVKDVGEKPTPLHTIDRIDNDGDYAPRNVRWATRKEQAHNTRLFVSEFCTLDGCSKKHKSRGMCDYHHTKWYREQNPEWNLRVQRAYREKNKEKNAQIAKDRYHKDPERVLGMAREARERNSEQYKKTRKAYYQKNIIKLREKSRERMRLKYAKQRKANS